jgi:hypothetical protein
MTRPASSLEDQIRAPADRYEAEIRAAGERYDAAMSDIFANLAPDADTKTCDREPDRR